MAGYPMAGHPMAGHPMVGAQWQRCLPWLPWRMVLEASSGKQLEQLRQLLPRHRRRKPMLWVLPGSRRQAARCSQWVVQVVQVAHPLLPCMPQAQPSPPQLQ